MTRAPDCWSGKLIMHTGTRGQILVQEAFTMRQRPLLSVYTSSTASAASHFRYFHSSPPRFRPRERNTSRYSTLRQCIVGRKWLCNCGRPAVHFEVKKSGPNKGMKCKFSLTYFDSFNHILVWRCPNFPGEQCGFFLWDEDEAMARHCLSSSPSR
jgi:hypothetical protein